MKIKPINKIYDAHRYFPMKRKEPYAALRGEVMAASLCGGLMIINSDIEATVFWANFDSIMSGDLGFIHLKQVVNSISNMVEEGWDNFAL